MTWELFQEVTFGCRDLRCSEVEGTLTTKSASIQANTDVVKLIKDDFEFAVGKIACLNENVMGEGWLKWLAEKYFAVIDGDKEMVSLLLFE